MINAIIVISPEYQDMVFGPAVVDRIRQRLHLVSAPLSAEELAARPKLLRDVEVMFCGWAPPILDQRLLSLAPRLRLVLYAAGSIKAFVTDALWARGIRVASAWAINGEAVAEYTLAVILFGLKQGFRYGAGWRSQHRFDRSDLPMGVSGTTVAVLSLGAAGRALCTRLRGFEVTVIAFDPHVPAAEAAALGVEPVSLAEAFARGNVVTVHTPDLPETRNLIRGEHLRRLTRGALFINTARGRLVHEVELIQTLRERPDLSVVLDVTEPEPPAADSPLFELPNVYLTPHIAGALGRDCRRLAEAMIDEYDRWLAGRPLRWEWRPSDFAHRA